MKQVTYIQHLENENELLSDDVCRLNNSIERYESRINSIYERLSKINLDSDSDSDSDTDSDSDSDSVSDSDSSVYVEKIVDVVVNVKQNDNLLLAINSVLNTSIILLTVYLVFSLLREY